MSRLTGLRAGVIVAAFVALPLTATAQGNQQTGTQQPPAQGTTAQPPQGTTTQQPPEQGTTPPQTQGTQPQGNQGFGQGQGENVRQQALGHLTAARQDLADITKLPAATHIQGEARNDLNQLISNFNALITSTGPEWRQAYDKVQGTLASLLGPDPAAQAAASGSTMGGSPVGTTGGAPPVQLDPTVVAKLNDLRQHIDEFGDTVGVKPGQSAVAQQGAQPGAAGTSGSAPNEQALRNIDDINSIVMRLLSQAPPDQTTVTVSRQDLQQIQQYLTTLRQSLGQSPVK